RCRLPSRFRSSERGSALVEAACVLPLLALVLLGTIDFGRLFYHAMAVTQAARAGAQYGSAVNPYRPSTGPYLVETSALAAGSDISGLTVAGDAACFCYSPSSGAETAISCGGGTFCSSTDQSRVYVTVTATAMFTTVVNYHGI